MDKMEYAMLYYTEPFWNERRKKKCLCEIARGKKRSTRIVENELSFYLLDHFSSMHRRFNGTVVFFSLSFNCLASQPALLTPNLSFEISRECRLLLSIIYHLTAIHDKTITCIIWIKKRTKLQKNVHSIFLSSIAIHSNYCLCRIENIIAKKNEYENLSIEK